MKPWSPYSTLFRSKQFGWFLYNALSGIMLELDEAHVLMVEKIRDGKPINLSEADKVFIKFLEENGFFASREDEQLQLMRLRYQRNAACFSTAHIWLTICPTLACNFGCPYCFEHSQDDAKVMSPETIDALVSFIKNHQDARYLSVIWYGGEPTIAFDVIKTLTERFLELYPDYDNASLVTNAYLLDRAKIKLLEDLKITLVQITLDGNEKTHNSRRKLKGGGSTYLKILDNVDALMNSSWKGRCSIRVNIDRTNQHEYAGLRAELLDRYKGKNLSFYPGHVNTFIDHPYDYQYGLCNSEWAEFNIGAYQKDGILPRDGLFPVSRTFNTCIATSYYGYVVGPRGELYKCWRCGKRKYGHRIRS